jgi:peptidoglycan hydrolase CwlO-like protein
MMACQEKVKDNPEKMKASLEEMEAAVETRLEEMKARMDVFEGTLDKIDAARKTCLGKMEANIETGQELREAEIRQIWKKCKRVWGELRIVGGCSGASGSS